MTNENRQLSKTSKFQDETLLRLFAIELNIDNLFHRMEAMSLTLQKLDTAYYEAHPDRLDKDARFEDQVRALKSPLNPKAPPKRS
jgi:hypothetical protein